MSKITVKHYLNKSLNPKIANSKKQYPVYIQVFVLGKSLKFKSTNTYFEYLNDADLKNKTVDSLLSIERQDVENIINSLISINKINLITSKNISLFAQNTTDVIDNVFCKMLINEHKETGKFIPSLLYSATYTDVRELIYFFNDELPLTEISSKVRMCLDVLNQLWGHMTKEIVLVYDFFYGDKYEYFIHELVIHMDCDAKEAELHMISVQNLLRL